MRIRNGATALVRAYIGERPGCTQAQVLAAIDRPTSTVLSTLRKLRREGMLLDAGPDGKPGYHLGRPVWTPPTPEEALAKRRARGKRARDKRKAAGQYQPKTPRVVRPPEERAAHRLAYQLERRERLKAARAVAREQRQAKARAIKHKALHCPTPVLHAPPKPIPPPAPTYQSYESWIAAGNQPERLPGPATSIPRQIPVNR